MYRWSKRSEPQRVFLLNLLLCFTPEWMRRPVKSSQNWAANSLGNWPFETAGSLLEPKECKTRVPLSRYLVQDLGRVPRVSWNNLCQRGQAPCKTSLLLFSAAREKQQKLQQVRGLARSPWDGGLHSAANYRGPVRVRFFKTSKWIFSWGWEKKSPVFHLLLSTLIVAATLLSVSRRQCLNKADQLPFSEKLSCHGLWEERKCKLLIAGLVLRSLL